MDDALDVFAVHGVGGIWGALATGLFATTTVNAAGADGLFYGNPGQLLKQAVAVAAVAAFTAAVTWIILKVVDVTVGLRVPEQGGPRTGYHDAWRGGVPVVDGETDGRSDACSASPVHRQDGGRTKEGTTWT